jgi:hypothetical protein
MTSFTDLEGVYIQVSSQMHLLLSHLQIKQKVHAKGHRPHKHAAKAKGKRSGC